MIIVNGDKCKGCLTCISVCPFTVLEEVNGKPHKIEKKGCLKCMHCAAACPEKALTFKGQEAVLEEELAPMSEGFEKELKEHILRRRSYRNFSSTPVNRELIKEALDLASWAPSAKNQHPTEWIIIDDEDVIKKMMEHILKYADEFGVSPEIISEFKDGNNVVMGTAPTLLLAHASEYAISPETDTAIAMATAELYLQSKGVGTCWAGYLKRMCNAIPEIQAMLPELPKKHSFYGAFMMGYPEKEEYLHIPKRVSETKIRWV